MTDLNLASIFVPFSAPSIFGNSIASSLSLHVQKNMIV